MKIFKEGEITGILKTSLTEALLISRSDIRSKRIAALLTTGMKGTLRLRVEFEGITSSTKEI